MAKDKGKPKDKNKDGENAESTEGGNKKMLIIIIAVSVLMMLIGAGAAVFLLGSDDDAGGAEGNASEQVAEEPAEGDPIYINMKPEFVVNLPPGGPAGMLQVAVTVYTRQQAVADFIAANDPLLRHHLNNLFESRPSAELLTLEGKQALQQAVQDLFQEQMAAMEQAGDVKGIYFTQFVLQ